MLGMYTLRMLRILLKSYIPKVKILLRLLRNEALKSLLLFNQRIKHFLRKEFQLLRTYLPLSNLIKSILPLMDKVQKEQSEQHHEYAQLSFGMHLYYLRMSYNLDALNKMLYRKQPSHLIRR